LITISMRLPIGKVGPRELERLVLPYIRLRDRRVLVGPRAGLDAAVIDCGRRVLVLSCDPITGALRDLGWLAVHINANDVATTGATPRRFMATLFAPEGFGGDRLKRLTKRVQAACDELGVSLVGGHTEVTPGLPRVIISGAMVGEAPKQRFVTSAGARPGDRIILTKTAAVEGTAILAADRERELTKALGHPLVARAKRFMRRISVVKEALTAARVGVTAMHDPTEGGLAGGLHELADASRVGFEVEGSKIPVARETRAICAYFGIDPLQLISSGSLLITARPGRAQAILTALKRAKIQAQEIGEIVSNRRVRQVSGRPIKFPKQDHLWRVFTK
jgi:thiamin-phosphate kinase